MRITFNQTIIYLESGVIYLLASEPIVENTNFCGDENIEGEVSLKHDILNTD